MMNLFRMLPPRSVEKIYDFYYFHLRRMLAAAIHLLGIFLLAMGRDVAGVKFTLLAARLNSTPSKVRAVMRIAQNHSDALGSLISSGVSREEAVARSIILSLPELYEGGIKKGVILVAFTRTLAFYSGNIALLKSLDRYFVFVIEPSSSGYADPDILYFMNNTNTSLVQATEVNDLALINSVYSKGRALSFGASNWIDSEVFKPSPHEKIYDSIYVANLNHVKRIYRYIDAVENIVNTADPNYKACLVCAQWGKSKGDLAERIMAMGLENNLRYFPGLARDDLIAELGKSKSSVLLSLKEGSNRSLFESMFVDIPVICLVENSGVNKSYINENTGYLISDAALEYAMLAMKNNYKMFSPRAWGLNNISADRTSGYLSAVLTSRFGGAVNSDLLIKVNRPELEYVNPNLDGKQLMRTLLNGFSEGMNGHEMVVLEKLRVSLVDHR
ncbi:MAG: glycosyltransferase [Moraxellaceae bacterium]|nr:MAG: glycosyltransferase [Moraxellaceae bacterium]